jgi:stage V sporulation protein SpoVS
MAAEIEDVLRVRRASSATKLASAIAHKLYDGETVVLKYIGAAACNQAVKAVIIAQRHVAEERGWTLSMRGVFVDVEMPDRPVTGVLLKVLVEK